LKKILEKAMPRAKTKTKTASPQFSKRQPPFYWPLILATMIMLEVGLLLNEKIWSHGYLSAKFERTWGQVEKTKQENEKIYSELSRWYRQDQQFIDLGFTNPTVEFVAPTQVSLNSSANLHNTQTKTDISQSNSNLGLIQ
jgi:hypothetical protein